MRWTVWKTTSFSIGFARPNGIRSGNSGKSAVWMKRHRLPTTESGNSWRRSISGEKRSSVFWMISPAAGALLSPQKKNVRFCIISCWQSRSRRRFLRWTKRTKKKQICVPISRYGKRSCPFWMKSSMLPERTVPPMRIFWPCLRTAFLRSPTPPFRLLSTT